MPPMDREAQVQDSRMDSAEFIFDITAPGDLPYVTRAIRCEAGGTIVGTQLNGENATLRFKAGETRPVRLKAIVSITGASGIEGMA